MFLTSGITCHRGRRPRELGHAACPSGQVDSVVRHSSIRIVLQFPFRFGRTAVGLNEDKSVMIEATMEFDCDSVLGYHYILRFEIADYIRQ